MSVRKKGKYRYGDSVDDLQAELERFSALNGHPATQFVQPACACGSKRFSLATNEDEGVALRTCATCRSEHAMLDSMEFMDNVDFIEHACACENVSMEILCGVALCEQSEDVRWAYLGCYCPKCKLVGVFADWKCESGPWYALLCNA